VIRDFQEDLHTSSTVCPGKAERTTKGTRDTKNQHEAKDNGLGCLRAPATGG
jgi:hypothetical protein